VGEDFVGPVGVPGKVEAVDADEWGDGLPVRLRAADQERQPDPVSKPMPHVVR
jgi:hypothetical protein